MLDSVWIQRKGDEASDVKWWSLCFYSIVRPSSHHPAHCYKLGVGSDVNMHDFFFFFKQQKHPKTLVWASQSLDFFVCVWNLDSGSYDPALVIITWCLVSSRTAAAKVCVGLFVCACVIRSGDLRDQGRCCTPVP